MYLGAKVIGRSPSLDILSVCFPLWLPVLFLLCDHLLTPAAMGLCLIGFFLLRELHFGATWLFFFVPSNRTWMARRPIFAFGVPLLILLSVVLVMRLKGLAAAIFLTNLASIYHTTRQSIGISKIYSEDNTRALGHAAFCMSVATLAFIIVGGLRFYFGYQLSVEQLFWLALGGAGACVCLWLLFLWQFRRARITLAFRLSVLTGMLMFYPFCFAREAEHALVIGLAMHWLQYLATVIPIYQRRSERMQAAGRRNRALLSSYLVLYAFVIFLLRAAGRDQHSPAFYISMVLVLWSYNLHFYFDAFLWRFSDSHIRREVGSYLFSPSGIEG